MIIGRLEDNVVVEAFLVDEVPPHMSHWEVFPDTVGLGWKIVDGVWEEPVVTTPVPERVSRFQARAALYRLGLLEAAEAITQLAGGEILLAWQDAQEFQRFSASINGLAPHLGLTPTQLDDIFRLAATIEA